jgi:hypothetical protein
MKTYRGVEVQLHAFITSELDGDEKRVMGSKEISPHSG